MSNEQWKNYMGYDAADNLQRELAAHRQSYAARQVRWYDQRRDARRSTWDFMMYIYSKLEHQEQVERSLLMEAFVRDMTHVQCGRGWTYKPSDNYAPSQAALSFISPLTKETVDFAKQLGLDVGALLRIRQRDQ
jgi:hypothetical protein